MKKILLSLIFVTVFPLASVYAAGKVYYASPAGAGDGSSYEKPCSFTSGINKISSGDTLYLLGGQYDLSARVNVGKGKSGTSSKRTLLQDIRVKKRFLITVSSHTEVKYRVQTISVFACQKVGSIFT